MGDRWMDDRLVGRSEQWRNGMDGHIEYIDNGKKAFIHILLRVIDWLFDVLCGTKH
jgi:hypothetical protein